MLMGFALPHWLHSNENDKKKMSDAIVSIISSFFRRHVYTMTKYKSTQIKGY